ncbi:MAG: hypothetical protein JSS98_11740 [Bacteroidetes bacterium]|nr:hypothetical protein [Bacteroidota bacterium]
MSCKFNLPFSAPPEVAVEQAKSAIESQNGLFEGDTSNGHFEVTVFGNNIKGDYIVQGQNLQLEITDKPFFVPCSMIESFLVKYIQ